MKWQHWLDPVGQYTSIIVAVKSQFVFVWSSVGFSLRRKLLQAKWSHCRKFRQRWGWILPAASKPKRTKPRASQESIKQDVLSRWRRLKPTLLGGGFFA